MPFHKMRLLALYHYASENSKDPSTKNASCFISAAGEGVMAVNGFVAGVNETPERWEKPLKYSYVEHAERAALYAAARHGYKTEGGTLYCPFIVCAECARAIIGCGISKVISHEQSRVIVHPHWEESIAIGMEMLQEADVEIIFVDAMLGVKILRNGKEFEV